MTDRWYSEQELEQLSRPTMDRVIEAIDAGQLEEAKRLCGEMRHEWQMLHDLMAAGVLDLVSFIQQRLGEDGVAEAWEQSMNRGWRRHHQAIEQLERRDLVPLLAATWRAHSCSGVGPSPGSFTVSEDEEKVTFSSSSVMVKLPGFGPTPEQECARHVAASSSTSSRRSRATIASWWWRQPRFMLSSRPPRRHRRRAVAG